MKKSIVSALLFAVILAATLGRLSAENETQQVKGFSLQSCCGKEVSLSDYKDKEAIVVLFMGTQCPINNYYMLRMIELHKEYGEKGVQFLGINSNDQDSLEQIKAHAEEHKLPFMVLKDDAQKVADVFKAKLTPEAFVLDSEGVIRYQGRIDDQYGVGYQRPEPTRRDLAVAIGEVLDGKKVSVAKTKVAGCYIGRAKEVKVTEGPTYSREVARIMQKHCQECHRPGQIGPFALMSYKHARSWADTIAERVADGWMPPWHADPRYGKFSNDRSMTKEEKATLLTWIENGCPEGDPKDMPVARDFRGSDGWRIGNPDAIIAMEKEFTVPAESPPNGVPYMYFTAKTNFKEDVWVQAAEARPGARPVVHHIIALIRKPGGQMGDEHDRVGGGHLVGTAPGDMPLILPDGIAKKIPKGSRIVFQMHYTPNGVEMKDRSSVGLIFAKKPPKYVSRTKAIMQARFAIPPGDGNYKVTSKATFEKDSAILSFMPHMHLRGKDFKYEAVYPDGRTEVLLNIPRYDFAWQSVYRLAEPLRIPAGTEIRCTAHFDNSVENPNNPDPTERVTWGDQTWEEMMIGWMNYYYTDENPVAIK